MHLRTGAGRYIGHIEYTQLPELGAEVGPGVAVGPAPVRLFLLTNRMNLNGVLSSRMLAPRESFHKYYADLLELSPGWVPLLTSPPPATLVASVVAERGSGSPVLVELSESVLGGQQPNGPVVYIHAAALSDVLKQSISARRSRSANTGLVAIATSFHTRNERHRVIQEWHRHLPASMTGTMRGWWRLLASRISRLNRSAVDADGEIGGEDFDDDAAVAISIVGDEDSSHSAAAELAADAFFGAEAFLEVFAEIECHVRDRYDRGQACWASVTYTLWVATPRRCRLTEWWRLVNFFDWTNSCKGL